MSDQDAREVKTDSGGWPAEAAAGQLVRHGDQLGARRLNKEADQSASSLCIVPGCPQHVELCPGRSQRAKVCPDHKAAKYVDLPSEGPSRFCQRCARFQPLDDYDGSKRSCRESLSAHNLRRRRNRAASSAAALKDPVHVPELRCMVDTCNKVLEVDRPALRRCKACPEHQRILSAMVKGTVQRFCQQCSRFHPLDEFDGNKRSCRARLDSHNRRRKKPGQLDDGYEDELDDDDDGRAANDFAEGDAMPGRTRARRRRRGHDSASPNSDCDRRGPSDWTSKYLSTDSGSPSRMQVHGPLHPSSGHFHARPAGPYFPSGGTSYSLGPGAVLPEGYARQRGAPADYHAPGFPTAGVDWGLVAEYARRMVVAAPPYGLLPAAAAGPLSADNAYDAYNKYNVGSRYFRPPSHGATGSPLPATVNVAASNREHGPRQADQSHTMDDCMSYRHLQSTETPGLVSRRSGRGPRSPQDHGAVPLPDEPHSMYYSWPRDQSSSKNVPDDVQVSASGAELLAAHAWLGQSAYTDRRSDPVRSEGSARTTRTKTDKGQRQ